MTEVKQGPKKKYLSARNKIVGHLLMHMGSWQGWYGLCGVRIRNTSQFVNRCRPVSRQGGHNVMSDWNISSFWGHCISTRDLAG